MATTDAWGEPRPGFETATPELATGEWAGSIGNRLTTATSSRLRCSGPGSLLGDRIAPKVKVWRGEQTLEVEPRTLQQVAGAGERGFR